MKSDSQMSEHICRDPLTYDRVVISLKELFSGREEIIHQTRVLAKKIRDGIHRIDPFIRQANQSVCPRCTNVCCISKHGYYTFEDLFYLFALGLEPPQVIFGRNDPDPCQFLREDGCSIERSLRPSQCNWYFCDFLLDYMEPQPAYREFDDTLREIAELWIEMVEGFKKNLDG